MCCTGKQIQPQIMSPQWQQNLMGQTAGMVGQGLGQGATQLPPWLQQQMMAGAQMNPMATSGANLFSNYWFGQPYQQPTGGMFPWLSQAQQGGGLQPGFGGGQPMPMGGSMMFPPGFDPYASRPLVQ